MTSWTAIQAHCKELFGFTPSMLQVRLWWFGRRGNGMGTLSLARKQWAIREIAPWDVIIKLALSYMAEQKNIRSKKLTKEEVCRFIYFLLWKSDQVRISEARDKKGKVFIGQTFWGYAAEHRSMFITIVSKRGEKSMRQTMKKILASLEDE